MDGIIEFLYLIGIVVICFITYTVYCYFDRSGFENRWKNIKAYCDVNGYKRIRRLRNQTDYRKALSRDDIQHLLDFYHVDCILPQELRYFDNISVTYVKPYEKHTGFSSEHHGGTRFHRFLTIEWFENGEWMHYSGIYEVFGSKPYVDADFGGVSSELHFTPESTLEKIGWNFEYELRYSLPKFKDNQIERRIKETNKP